MTDSEDIERVFQRARDSNDKEARDLVITALQSELRKSVPGGIQKRFGAQHRMNPEDYISKMITKLLTDWENTPDARVYWKRDTFQDLVKYAHTGCINMSSDSERGEEVRKNHNKVEVRKNLSEQKRKEARGHDKSPTDERRSEANGKVQDLLKSLDLLVSTGAISERDRQVWKAWHLTERHPKRSELVDKFDLSSDDEVSRIVGDVNKQLKRNFPGWGPNGNTELGWEPGGQERQ